ncbi:TCP-1/cpn60 chaperonin family protein [bacterium]|nr:TCP-1/cpn60 chaperonin family protein [bacterium]
MTPSDGEQARRNASAEREERLSALQSNAAAIAAVAAAVEGTLGPRGLDSMLVGRGGEVTITNDGSTILQEIEVNHPAARLLIATARAQDEQVGDGTTTATILAAALVAEGVKQVQRGVPVTRVIEGLRLGLAAALQALREAARPVTLDDPLLRQAALVAGRGQADLADLVLQAARRLPADKLLHDPAFRLGGRLTAIEGADNEVLDGLLIEKQRLSKQMPLEVAPARLLLLDDALEPEEIEPEALATEAGFQRYLDLQRDFLDQLGKLAELQVNCVMTQRGIAEAAEEALGEQGVLAVRRLTRRDMAEIARHTGARPLKRSALRRPVAELAPCLGRAERVAEDERHGHIRITGGSGEGTATIIVSAATAEVRQERLRIAEDAAAAVQAALQGGLLPGGGAAEIAALPAVLAARKGAAGMAAYGLDCVSEALKRPLAQIVANAGYNPLEKVEEVVARAQPGAAIGVDCDTGETADMLALGVVDAAPVKLYALQAAGEIATAVLRIATVIRRRDERPDEAANGER